MSKAKWCVRCGEERTDTPATDEVDGDPLCGMHARIAYALEAGCAVKVQGSPVVDPVELEEAAAAPAAPAPVRNHTLRRLCRRGCGKESHYGRCVGEEYLPRTVKAKAVPIAPIAPIAAEEIGGGEMDVLVCEEIAVSDVPSGRERQAGGRMGMLWLRLMALPEGTALKVKCRDAEHAGQTNQHLKSKAARMDIRIGRRRVGNLFYCWREGVDEAAR